MEKFYERSLMKKASVLIGIMAAAQVCSFNGFAQQFTAGRLVVERVGNGSAQSSAATPVFLDEYTTGGASGVSIALPTTTGPLVNQVTESGIASSDGFLTRSMDGTMLAVPGYDAAVGTPSVVSSGVNKVITRIDQGGNLASTVVTDATAFSGNNFRSVATVDGSEYWMSGAGNGAVYVIHRGNTTPVAGTQVSSTITDDRQILIYNNQLYQGTAVTPNTGIYNVGTGLPTTPGAVMSVDANTGASGDPYGFVIVQNSGLPVMYVADFSNKLIRKYFKVGTTWNAAGSVTVTVGGTATGFYGITANVAAGAVHIYLTTSDVIGSNSRIVTFNDGTTGSTVITGTVAGTTIVGPTTNTAFRGITFVPFAISSITSAVPAVCSGTGTTITISGTPNTTVIYQINGVNQPAFVMPNTGTYSFATGALTTPTTYTVVSVSDGIITQSLGMGTTVNINALPPVTAGPASTVCAGTPVGLTSGGAVTYTWAPAGGLSATTGNSVTATVSAITTYTVTGTDVNGCVNTAHVTITILAQPIISTSTPVAICNGSSALLAVSGGSISYVWTPGTGLSATTGGHVTASPSSTTTYTITGTASNGCTNSITNTLTVNPLPVVTAGGGASICTGGDAVLTGSGALTYTWLPTTGLSAFAGVTVDATPAVTTTYTVTGTDANGCKGTAPVTVTVNPLPPVSAGASLGICIGGSTTLNATGAATYVWSPGTGLSSTLGSSVTANPTTTTTYSVVGTDINGCINFSFVTVSVNPLPVLSTSTPTAICLGSSSLLVTTGALTYSWSPATGLSATTGSSVMANPTGTTTYTIIGTDVNGCVSTITNTLTVNPLPLVTASAGATVCQGSSAVLSAAGALTYTWLPTYGLSAFAGVTVNATPPTTTTYTVTGTDINGCTGTATVMVSVNPLPTITAGPPVDFCVGGSTTFTATGGVSYIWSPGSSLSTTVGPTVTASPSVTTTYTIVGTDANGCMNTGFATVNIHPLPYVFPGPGAGICIGNSTPLTVAGTTAYTWSPAAGLSATTGNYVNASPTSTTTYTITGTSLFGCMNSATVTVTVFPIPIITASPNVAICHGASTGLTASGGVTYSWAPSYGLSVTTGNSVTAHPTATTTYTITAINYCVGSTTVTVSVNPLPSVVGYGATICSGGSASISAAGASTYTWTPATALSATVGSSVTSNPTANTIYTITGTDVNGCVNTATATVLVNLLPVITTGGGTSICNGASTTITAAGGVSYTWTPGTSLSATTGSSVVASPSTSTIYTVTGVSPYGCTSNATVNVGVHALPTLYAVTGGGTFCAGGIGVPVGLAGSQGGMNYALYNGTLFTGITRVGTGSALNFGHPSSSGYYRITATDPATACLDTMTGGAGITINHAPTPVSVTGGGAYCPGGMGQHVGLIGSAVGTLYQLYLDSVAVDTPVAGSGLPIDFGLKTAIGTYTATAVDPGTSCVANMTGSASISILPLPPLFTVTGGGAYCAGATGVHIGINGSQIGDHYQVYLGGSPMGSSMIGMNTPLDFGTFTAPGVYKVTSTVSATGCYDTMTGTATVIINPTPTITGRSMILHQDTTTLVASPTGGTWSSQFPAIVSVGPTTGLVTGVALGASTITYSLSTGCSATHYITIAFNVGVNNVNAVAELALMPNPNNGTFTLKGTFTGLADQQVVIDITNLIGQSVLGREAVVRNGVLDEQISINNMPAGVYLLSLKTATDTKVVRFVKE